jgi:predicted RNA-binding protein
MRYFLIVASKDHVKIGVENGFAQAGHGKKTQLQKLRKDDWVIYYSSKDKLKDGKTYQKFTALGQVDDNEPFQVTINTDFEPWRRRIKFYPINELEIRPILDDLNFITNRKNWGLHLMSGFVEINKTDFNLIADKMLLNKNIGS